MITNASLSESTASYSSVIDVKKVADLVRQLAEARFQQRHLQSEVDRKSTEIVELSKKLEERSSLNSGHEESRAHPANRKEYTPLTSSSSTVSETSSHRRPARGKRATTGARHGSAPSAPRRVQPACGEAEFWRHNYKSLRRKYKKQKQLYEKDLGEIQSLIAQMNLEQGRHELERENTRLQDKLFYLTQAKEPVVINQYTERCPSRSGVSHLNNSKEVSSMTATGRTAHHTPTPVPPSADSAPPPVSDICVSPKRVEVAQPSVQLRAGNVSGGSPYNDISLCDNEEALRQEVELWKSRCMRLLDTKEKEGVERSKVSVTPVERSALSQHNASTQTTEQHNRKEKKQERVHTPADVSRGQAEQPTMTTQNAVDAFPASLNGPPPGHLFMNTSGNLAVAPPPYVDTGSPSHYGAVVTPFPTPFVQPYIYHYDSLRHQESRDRIERDIRRNDQLLAAISKLQSTASMHGPRKTT